MPRDSGSGGRKLGAEKRPTGASVRSASTTDAPADALALGKRQDRGSMYHERALLLLLLGDGPPGAVDASRLAGQPSCLCSTLESPGADTARFFVDRGLRVIALLSSELALPRSGEAPDCHVIRIQGPALVLKALRSDASLERAPTRGGARPSTRRWDSARRKSSGTASCSRRRFHSPPRSSARPTPLRIERLQRRVANVHVRAWSNGHVCLNADANWHTCVCMLVFVYLLIDALMGACTIAYVCACACVYMCVCA